MHFDGCWYSAKYINYVEHLAINDRFRTYLGKKTIKRTFRTALLFRAYPMWFTLLMWYAGYAIMVAVAGSHIIEKTNKNT